MICFVIGRILLTEAALLMLPMAVALVYGEAAIPFLIPALLLAVIGVLVIVIFALLIKIYLMHKSALEIAEGFEERLAEDTNTLIDISSRDPYLCQLASAVNVQLRLLRKQRQRYLSGDRELKEAVTNISHDLRTPLTAICGYLDLLQREDMTENAARYLSLIRGRADAMKQLTEELFRYSVILSTVEPELETVHVNGVLEESIAAYYAALTARGIQPQILMTGKRIERRLNREALSRKPAEQRPEIQRRGPGHPAFGQRGHHLLQPGRRAERGAGGQAL